MGKLAFVFSGQGDQFPGMGKNLYDEYFEAKRVFDLCDTLRPGTSEQCFYGSKEELTDTINTQPCLYAMELAAAEVLRARGIVPDTAAGFSLGEVVAASFAGVFSAEQGFRLIMKRAELMKEAADRQPSFMGAVLRLDGDEVREICDSVDGVYAVNFNCPGQTTISGYESQKPLIEEKIREAGGRMITLRVSGAFHSPFMKTAAEGFLKELKQESVGKPDMKVYSNVTALPYDGDVCDLLSRQVMSPVLWEKTIRNTIRDGVDTFVEIGPGNTLSGMIKRIDSTVGIWSVSDLPKILQEVKTC